MRVQDYFFILASVILTFYLLIIGQNVLIPLVLAIFTWYLIITLAEAMSRIPLGDKRLPDTLSFSLAILTILGVLVMLGGLVSRNVADVVAAAPTYQKNLDRLIAEGYAMFNIERPPDSMQLLKKYDFAYLISQAAGALTSLVSRGGLVFALLLLIFAEQKMFSKKLEALISNPQRREAFSYILQRIDADIRAYIGIKSFVCLLSAGCGFILFTLVGVDFAVFWAILIFILNFIPSIGSIIATVLPSMVALLQFESHAPFFIVFGGVILVQQIIANFVEPRLMSRSLNTSPLVVMIFLLIWGKLWGITGMFLCVPIMVISMIIFSYFKKTHPVAVLLSRTGELKKLEKTSAVQS
jgi:predicted PurR-regulated permease PerM